ncbi:hypothetical protein L3X38_039165 [Prunus dulcis]|uniref:Uncharacterized protein n=1 Tax=Prunus dulcis TaxID=3755 RepID=A0AAD4V8R5_PRUDU|nr:hypothetical protein L3X38_039165 [Prunus dulcis]
MHPLAATTGKALALRRDFGSESENPSFEVAMWFSYIRFAGFSLSTIISLSSLVRVSDGRTWPVNVRMYQFLGVWRAFVRDWFKRG